MMRNGQFNPFDPNASRLGSIRTAKSASSRIVTNGPPPNPISTAGLIESSSEERLVGDIMWRKVTNKKHKTWDGDGNASWTGGKLIVSFETRTVTFQIAKDELEEGKILTKSGVDVELGSFRISDLPSKPGIAPVSRIQSQVCDRQPMSAGRTQGSSTPSEFVPSKFIAVGRKSSEPPAFTEESQVCRDDLMARTKIVKPAKRKMASMAQGFDLRIAKKQTTSPESIAHPVTEMPQVHELVKPLLRPHQVEGVQFLYDAVTGKRHDWGYGGLLADEMGLGKTLTSIALIWSLLKNKVIKNALVVVPVTLLGNWKAEFKKWLGENRLGVLVATPGTDVSVFYQPGQRAYQVLIAGYEKIRDIAPTISKDFGTFDLVVCDEGHRLKSRDSQTFKSLERVAGDKRIILSGTPIQNNLVEFFSLADFLNPGVFSHQNIFVKRYAEPIAASREPHAPLEAKQLGNDRAEELMEIIDEFLLRRDLSTLSKYLDTPRSEYVVFCQPTDVQIKDYKLALRTLGSSLSGETAFGLETVTTLRKCSNSVIAGIGERKISTAELLGSSGKMKVLARILSKIAESDEKVVVVSGSTRVLDLIQSLCVHLSYPWLRLDGQTPQQKRQTAVNIFNKSSSKRAFAFLLSARSGGAGLNLVGASNMVIFDCDWNPAIDIQAMARIHRDGQTRPIKIYRLVTTGMIDEKILQRQLSKIGLASSILCLEQTSNVFSAEELRDLTSFKSPPQCDTVAKEELLTKGGMAIVSKSEIAALSDIPQIDAVLQRQYGGGPRSEICL